ncbi:MAG: endonuclease/exonuclease/phosphatase family protein [Bacteroidota bacterium]
MRFSSLLFFFFLSIHLVSAQKQQYKVGCVGFYNFENLFDIENDTLIRDDEFTPKGRKGWTTELYQDKLDQLASVVSEVGTEMTPDGLSILGICEVENKGVLEDFVQHPKLAKRNYQIVHFDSKDWRGIDVALIYQPKYYEVLSSKSIDVGIIMRGKDSTHTRDILLVEGLYDGDPLYVMVNHWPSRGGGEKVTMPMRNQAAMACRKVIDSLQAINPLAKVIVMGDLNDDPISPSVKDFLRATGKKKKVGPKQLFNPMYDYYKKGLGTTAWRDAWSLFDQIIVSPGLIQKNGEGYQFYKAKVFNKKHMVQRTGQFKGYPFRTFVGDAYLGGYSDHFPVYAFLVKAI